MKSSSNRVQYELRTNKQIERRMIVNVFQLMSQANFQISNYHYTGFGGNYFIDFILFHRILGIKHMVNVEHDETIKNRVIFNTPFSNKIIENKFGPISNFIPDLHPDIKHILWLDYDSRITDSILSDCATAVTQLSKGSIILVTIDVETLSIIDKNKLKREATPKECMDYYDKVANSYMGPGLKDIDFNKQNLPETTFKILYKAMKQGLTGRPVEFLQIFKFVYADGHKMITLGGVIGDEEEKNKIKASGIENENYVRLDTAADHYEINAPKFTKREKGFLDANMPCEDNWKPENLEFKEQELRTYREIYRFYPAYAELLLW